MNTDDWKAIYDSVKGTSHSELGLPCQDALRVVQLSHENGQWLVACAADGAGSATHSAVGSKIACDSFVSIVDREMSKTDGARRIDRETILNWLGEIRNAIELEAINLGVEIRQLACTFLASIVGESTSIFVQIGDGAITIWNGESYEPVFWPQVGEYASMTNFLTDPRYADYVEWKYLETRVDEFAMFTDGLERLILRFADRSVHGPFLEPLFASLRQAADPDDYFAPLQSFLDSPRINERTDDDKTLILATRLT